MLSIDTAVVGTDAAAASCATKDVRNVVLNSGTSNSAISNVEKPTKEITLVGTGVIVGEVVGTFSASAASSAVQVDRSIGTWPKRYACRNVVLKVVRSEAIQVAAHPVERNVPNSVQLAGRETQVSVHSSASSSSSSWQLHASRPTAGAVITRFVHIESEYTSNWIMLLLHLNSPIVTVSSSTLIVWQPTMLTVFPLNSVNSAAVRFVSLSGVPLHVASPSLKFFIKMVSTLSSAIALQVMVKYSPLPHSSSCRPGVPCAFLFISLAAMLLKAPVVIFW
mmetsp:Transcript_9900/g.16993  ORF Transcript_9900/g.16993 Transcript_9900/m.16993 type:complete len:279 (+) Transcript_9900:449-1285(+)